MSAFCNLVNIIFFCQNVMYFSKDWLSLSISELKFNSSFAFISEKFVHFSEEMLQSYSPKY